MDGNALVDTAVVDTAVADTMRHDGGMSVLNRGFGPRPRDELAAWSTASLASADLAPIPAYTAPSPPGRVLSLHGQDAFVRKTAGPTDAPHVWYIHGLDGASGNWDRLAGALSSKATGFAVDLPGSGESGPPPHNYDVLTEVAWCAELIRRTSAGPVHLVGNSRGGVVATFLAARHPELVRTLTVISPAVSDFRLVGERGAAPRLALVMLPGAVGPAVRLLGTATPADRAQGLAQMCFGEPEALTEADLAAAEDEFARRGRLPWIREATVRSLRSLIRAQLRPGRWSLAAAARSVRAPVLVVWGTRDCLVDARLARPTTASFRDARLLMLARTGHVAQMERPELVARAMLALWETVPAGRGPELASPAGHGPELASPAEGAAGRA